MNQPELFDIVELLTNLPEDELSAGVQGTIVECYGNDAYEVEFSDSDGETLALCTLSPEQFVIVWQGLEQLKVKMRQEEIEINPSEIWGDVRDKEVGRDIVLP